MQAIEISALGRHLERELALVGSNDTLSRWMAYRVAELRIAAEAKTGAERVIAEERWSAQVLELWRHRAALPGACDPVARLAPLAEVLERLEAHMPWFHQVDETAVDKFRELERAGRDVVRDYLLMIGETVVGGPTSDDRQAADAAAGAPVEKLRQLLERARTRVARSSGRPTLPSLRDRIVARLSDLEQLAADLGHAMRSDPTGRGSGDGATPKLRCSRRADGRSDAPAPQGD